MAVVAAIENEAAMDAAINLRFMLQSPLVGSNGINARSSRRRSA
jgi:hypothetical protein